MHQEPMCSFQFQALPVCLKLKFPNLLAQLVVQSPLFDLGRGIGCHDWGGVRRFIQPVDDENTAKVFCVETTYLVCWNSP